MLKMHQEINYWGLFITHKILILKIVLYICIKIIAQDCLELL